jgi:hypothetical protein
MPFLEEPGLVKRDPLQALQSRRVKNIKTNRPLSVSRMQREAARTYPSKIWQVDGCTPPGEPNFLQDLHEPRLHGDEVIASRYYTLLEMTPKLFLLPVA